ncbi:MAG: YbhB/YbcL family Raf kinase inhibitor-like protein [Gammaproteobacteria bacterium]|nr:YbhB/YbcL family Raf kinase inhibitor-like protein [Gammaproteobacteria bacterium]
MTMQLLSSAFKHQSNIPTKYTCEGIDISPALSWSDVPQGAKSLVLIVDDPDAPDPEAPRMVWCHWLLYNISPQAGSLAESVKVDELPPGTLQGMNDWKRTGYGGPCPPIGRHRYFLKLYALDTLLSDMHSPTKEQLEHAIQSHIIEQTELIGFYEKSK